MEVCDLESVVGECGASSEKCPYAGGEFAEIEGFGEVIVGTGVEASNSAGDFVLGGEEEDWRGVASIAEGAADGESVEAREHDIENDEVVLVDVGFVESVGAGG